MSDSSACASCHTLKTTFVDSEGNIASTTPDREFPEQMPYVEWEHSDFGPGGPREQTCQSCHMPRRESAPLANRPNRLNSRTDVAEHGFLGANTLMLEILATYADELGVPPANFGDSIRASRVFLRKGVAVKIIRAEIMGGELQLDVRVVNRTGHKFPTGYPSRRAFLHVKVLDPQGTTVFESGRVRKNGQVVGVAADVRTDSYEPHFNVIRRAGQVQVYEAVMGDTDGNITHSLLRAADYLKDNRIPPFGFDKAAVPRDIRVAGRAESDRNFRGGSDIVRYRVPVPPGEALSVQVALNYQAIGFDSFRDLMASAEHPAIARFGEYFEGARNKTELVAKAEAVIQP
jgi:hypothetical protein